MTNLPKLSKADLIILVRKLERDRLPSAKKVLRAAMRCCCKFWNISTGGVVYRPSGLLALKDACDRHARALQRRKK